MGAVWFRRESVGRRTSNDEFAPSEPSPIFAFRIAKRDFSMVWVVRLTRPLVSAPVHVERHRRDWGGRRDTGAGRIAVRYLLPGRPRSVDGTEFVQGGARGAQAVIVHALILTQRGDPRAPGSAYRSPPLSPTAHARVRRRSGHQSTCPALNVVVTCLFRRPIETVLNATIDGGGVRWDRSTGASSRGPIRTPAMIPTRPPCAGYPSRPTTSQVHPTGTSR
jgi:hypothetical protein